MSTAIFESDALALFSPSDVTWWKNFKALKLKETFEKI